MDAEPQVFRATRAILVESIWWDERSNELVWVDITAGTLHRGDLDGALDGSDDRVTALPPPVSAVQPHADGGYVATVGDRVVVLDAEGRVIESLARIEHAHPGMRLNEGKVDPFGRFVVGSMGLTSDRPDAAVYLVDADGKLRTLRGGFGVVNGMEWSDRGDEMYVTDTAVRTVYRAAYGPDGDLGALEPHLVGFDSDGLARSADGCFWNGVYGGSRVLRWSAEGHVLGELRIPAPQVTSVAFGGPDLSTLFVGTARENLTEDDLLQHPLSGAIFRIDDVGPGLPVHGFGRATDIETKD